MIYFDASVIVAMLAAEPRREAVRAWFLREPAGNVCISPWVETEVSSALSIKRRIGSLDPDIEADARLEWRRLVAEIFEVFPIQTADFHTAADLCARPDLGLRGPDALHLAIARRLGLGLATFDSRMADAARRLGIALVDFG